MSTFTALRHETDRGTIVGRLQEVASAATDVVALPTAIDFHEGTSLLSLDKPMPVLDADGVTSVDQLPLRFNRSALRQQAERFDIPLKYVDTLAAEQPELLAYNFNERASLNPKPTLYRMLRTNGHYTVRAALSNGYQAIDNLDMFTAVVRGAARADIDLSNCRVEADWTDDRFRMRIAVPQIAIHVPDLLGDYRSPFPSTGTDAQGRAVGDVIWAGLEASNSETGDGAVSLAPRAVILKCLNGMTHKADIVRSVHLGGRLESGPVTWSEATRRKAVELVESKVADAVSRFCSAEYLNGLANSLRAAKGIQVDNPVKAVEVAKARLGFSDAEVESALGMFVKSGDSSVLGLAQAFTAAAQGVEDGDRQSEMEQAFFAFVGAPAMFNGAA
jgi:hypothetical protein